jgi:toxin ParE1/3/4
VLRLEKTPDRGHIPPELERIGVQEFREVFYKPYRIIYQIIGNNVYVHCILDGRRDMQDILQQRVLR